jgi:hypothetical protein
MSRGHQRLLIRLTVVLILLYALTTPGFTQSSAGEALPRFGVQAKASTLGAGIEAATAISRRSNVRFGFNMLDLGLSRTEDGIHYDATFGLRSFQANLDYYLIGGFHVSPGALLYNGNKVDATAFVPGGRSFDLSDATFFSDINNPVRGTGSVAFNKAAPMVLLGFGNLLPRSRRHFTVNFDVGVVFQGSPRATLNLSGGTCDSRGLNCLNIGANPGIQTNIQAEQNKLNEDLKPFRYYPVISLGFGWKF